MTDDTRVLYNAQCPVCSYEINHYADYADRQALPIRFEDLNACQMADWGLSRDAAARRLYVLKDGVLLSGIPAFAALWEEMPRYRWLARLVRLPVIRTCAAFAYDRIAAPLIYRSHLRRMARSTLS